MKEITMDHKWIEKFEFTNITEKKIRELVKKFGDEELFWQLITAFQTLSEDFMREYQDKIHWGNASTCQEMSEQFITEFADKVNWHYLCTFKTLDIKFIEQHADKVDWYSLCCFKKLSEQLIEKYIDKFDSIWEQLIEKQELSEEFLMRHKDKWLKKNKLITSIRTYQKINHNFLITLLRQQQRNADEKH